MCPRRTQDRSPGTWAKQLRFRLPGGPGHTKTDPLDPTRSGSAPIESPEYGSGWHSEAGEAERTVSERVQLSRTAVERLWTTLLACAVADSDGRGDMAHHRGRSD
jgi:hypothetical protein